MPSEPIHNKDSANVIVTHGGLAVPHSPRHQTIDGDSGLPVYGASHRNPNNPGHIAEDLRHLKAGILDEGSFANLYKLVGNPFSLIVHDKKGKLKARRHSANLRSNVGGDLWAKGMGGDPLATVGFYGTLATGVAATTLTDTGQAWTVNSWVGRVVYTAGVQGVVRSNTATILTIDRWTLLTTPGSAAAAATPAAAAYYIAGVAPFRWIALTNDATAAATTDYATASVDNVLTTEITANGLARAYGVYAHTGVAGGTTTTVGSLWTVQVVFTATGTQACQKSALCNTSAAATGNIGFEALFTSASLISGDTCTTTWSPTS